MRMFYVGVEFTHDKQMPNAIFGEKATRVGPIKRWVDAGSPHMVNGKLRERVGLVLPSGFRFRKDEVKNYKRAHNTVADAKFQVAMVHALGKYLPYATKTQTPKLLPAPSEQAVPSTTDSTKPGVATDRPVIMVELANETQVSEGSPKA
jgi:hypothetical protein